MTNPAAGGADELIEGLLSGDQRSLARAISVIEDREPAYRELVSALYRQPGDAAVIGVTGSPGVGKSTLVAALAGAYRDRGDTVGVVAIDPSSPFSGGALLGDRVRMGETAGDMEVFVRSMSARGNPGGLAAATMDAVRALSAFGKDVVIVETVGAGQNEVDVVTTADTVLVVTQPTAGDDVQALKAGILEIGDVYVVNKADLPGADRTVHDLRTMIEEASTLGSHRAGSDLLDTRRTGAEGDGPGGDGAGEDGTGGDGASGDGASGDGGPADADWTPPVVETEAMHGAGIGDLVDTIDDHLAFLDETGLRERKARVRVAGEVRNHLAAEVEERAERAIEDAGGIDALVQAIRAGDADPYGLAADLVGGEAGRDRDAAPTTPDEG
jgi:LAO/AO transport system kinase